MASSGKMSPTDVLRQMFPGMEEDDLVEMTSVAEPRTYPADTVLCREGQVESTFYAIVSGEVEVVKRLDDETEEVINRPGAGNFVGEIALVQEGPRTATVRTIKTTTVLEIDRDSFLGLLHCHASMAVRIMLRITPRLRDIDLTTIAHLREKNAELTKAYEELQQQVQELEEQLK